MSEKVVTIAGRQIDLSVDRSGGAFRSGSAEIELLSVSGSEAEIRAGGQVHSVPFSVDGSTVSFVFAGEIYTAVVTEKSARSKARHRDHSLAAPMPGLILKIVVRPGDVVIKGAPLVVLEAMKMEHQVIAPHDGTVSAVNCREGEMVQAGVELIEIVTAGDPAPGTTT